MYSLKKKNNQVDLQKIAAAHFSAQVKACLSLSNVLRLQEH